jgi:hypothetical protein
MKMEQNIISMGNKPGDVQTEKQFVFKSLLLATNTENLKSFITTGVIHPREGFQKYYNDLSRHSPGHIPLYIDTLPDSWIPECQEEEDIDVAIISIDMSWEELDEKNSIYIKEKQEQLPEIPGRWVGVPVVYYKGVIPVSKINTIVLQSREAKKRLLSYGYSNFNPHFFTIKVQPKRFTRNKNKELELFNPSEQVSGISDIGSPYDYTSYQESSSRGGVLAILMHSLPNISEARHLFESIVHQSPMDSLKLELLPKQMKYIRSWLWKESVEIKDVDSFLLWHLLNLLATYDPLKGLTSSIFLADLQQQLETKDNIQTNTSISYDELKLRFKKRFDQIQNAVDQTTDPSIFFNDKTMQSTIIRALLLFLLRQKSVWQFHEERELVKEWSISAEDFLFANLFYGVWQGWFFLEDMLRPKNKKVTFAVSEFMADWYNKIHVNTPTVFFNGKNLELSEDCVFWEKKILKAVPWQINHKLGQFAVYLAKRRNWPALHSRIVIPQENLSSLSYEADGKVVISMKGEVTVKESIDRTLFFENLDQTELDDNELEQFKILYFR